MVEPPTSGDITASNDSFFQALREIDQLLLQIEQMIVASRSHSPFNSYLNQLSVSQIKVLSDGISEIRTAMLCLVRRETTDVEAPTLNIARAIRKSIQDAAVKLDDAPPLADSAKTRRGLDLDAPLKMLREMKNVFRRMEDVLV